VAASVVDFMPHFMGDSMPCSMVGSMRGSM